MIEILLSPFQLEYMANAIWLSSLIGLCSAFISCYLILKGWSLMGDALAHAIVPGVSLAYLLKLPFALGAFIAGILASWAMNFIKQQTKLKEDVAIGVVLSSFFSLGLFIISLNPTSVNLQSIILGQILSISPTDIVQVLIICSAALILLCLKWKDFILIFFDEIHAKSLGMNTKWLYILFFSILSAVCVASLQAVGACLVISMVITPGATAYQLTHRFSKMIILSCFFGFLSSFLGSYLSYFLNVHTGGLIVLFQCFFFSLAFIVNSLQKRSYA